MKFYITYLLLFFVTVGCAQSKEKSITEFSRNDIKDGILIDVRTPQEYEAGHLEEALNVDWFKPDFAEQILALDADKEEPVYLYCKKGGRSAKAAQVLDSLGYKNVVDLLGGYEAYRLQQQ